MDSVLHLIQKNEAWIWKNVYAFVKKQSLYGTMRCDKDDLYQECALYILEKYLRTGKPVEEFKVSHYDLLHVMCQYMQSLLPVKVPKTVRNYKKMMQKYSVQPNDEKQTGRILNISYRFDDCMFFADVTKFAETLPERDRALFELVLRGYSWEKIGKIAGITHSAVYRAKRRIGKYYARYMSG